MTKAPRSILPKANRRGGARPLKLVWPARPRRRHLGLSKREWAAVRRYESRRLAALVRKASAVRKILGASR